MPAGLVLVIGLGIAHAAAHALWRPLYQVSDELVYLSIVQARAVGDDLEGRCIAPPQGRAPIIPVQAKPGFLIGTATQLTMLCASGVGDTSLIALRLLQALSLGVSAGCAWALARLLTGNDSDALLAGVLVATHPVAAMYAGGVTPDAWANAFSGIAFLTGTRLLFGRGHWWEGPLLVTSTIGALAWKDTATFLLVLPLCVLGLRVRETVRDRKGTMLSLTGLMVAVPVLAAAGILWFRSPYFATEIQGARPAGPGAWGYALARDLAAQLPTMLTSSWTAIGSFGASTLTTPPVADAIGIVLVIAGIVGACRRWTGVPRLGAVAATWALCGFLCLIQPSARQVLLGTVDVHQGRWLLPMLAPVAVLLACGINGLVREARLLPLAVVGAGAAAIASLLATASYYWEGPDVLRHASLFLRGTSGTIVDDTRVLSTIRHVASQVPNYVASLAALTMALGAVTCLHHGVTLLRTGAHVRHTHDR